ncbi:hypothetical protein DPMN_180516 [Dreissena polymorpha]|uniref:Homeobox domain-containing protein n=1 Tax=Dreissena polymorpha TaxID=45954 RepID=A0A9D4EEV0_DREPO|nr:hypothetical protein DPMN_180516 [Dreissena polymorpha]
MLKLAQTDQRTDQRTDQQTNRQGKNNMSPTTIDNVGALKLWLTVHSANPYPNKPEKIMLAILSDMTLTQVATWFANARRRLRKSYAGDPLINNCHRACPH